MATIKQKIKTEIRQSTYTYYKDLDICFCDYIYGDRYYTTLQDVIYRFLTTHDCEFDFNLGNINIDLLVNDLYYHFITTDKKFSYNYPGSSERHRKNYIMKSLRNATGPLLIKQLKENEVIAHELYELDNLKDLHYISIYSQDGGLIEDLSYKIWEKEKSNKDETEIQIGHLGKIFKFLNLLERRVVYLVAKYKTYSEIATILQIDQDKVRKIIYSATKKMRDRHSFKRQCA